MTAPADTPGALDPMTLGEIATALHAPRYGGEPGVSITSVGIDSRTLAPGALFVALTGTAQDGHRYIPAAFARGAAAALVTQAWFEAQGGRAGPGPVIVVPDTLKGLQDLARASLDRYPRLLRIGITGSSGKTTTKELAAAIIQREKRLVINPGNLNSETGLPLSVFQVRHDHDVGIFELGMNRPGEIRELAAVLRPRIGLITNIGTAHIGHLGSRDAIAAEKKALFSQFTGTETALIPAADPYGPFLADKVRGRVRFFPGIPDAAVPDAAAPDAGLTGLAGLTDRGLAGWEFTWEGLPIRFPLVGRHNLRNALAAIAIAQTVGVSGRAIQEGLAGVRPLFGRGEVLSLGPIAVIQDCYNANPESMAEAIGFGDRLDWQGRRVYVIGAMGELGAASEAAHRDLGERLRASRADLVCLCGPETRTSAAALAPEQGLAPERGKPVLQADTLEAFIPLVGAAIRPGDLVLVKGSRACALEQVTQALAATWAG